MKYRFERNVDADGWFKLPESMQDEYGDGYIGMGFACYLHMMTVGAWKLFEQNMTDGRPSMPVLLDEDLANIGERLVYGIVRLKKDNNGRVRIPAELREAAGIKEKIIGVFVLQYWRVYALEEFNRTHDLQVDGQRITE